MKLSGVATALLLGCAALAAPPPSVSRYNQPLPVPPRAPLAAQIEALTQQLARDAGKQVPTVEPRLEAALQLLATHGADKDAPPSTEATAEALWMCGIVEPLPFLLTIGMSDGGDQAVLEQVRANIPSMLQQGRYRRVAASVTPTRGQQLRVLVALQESFVDLDPVARRIDIGRSITVAGKLLPGLANAEIFITPPSRAKPEASGGEPGTPPESTVLRAPVTEQSGRFAGPFRCDAPGVYRLEVVADGEFGATVLANFPLYCGVDPPRSLDAVTAAVSLPWRDAAEAEARVLALVNRDRAHAGLGPVRADPKLTAVARAHSVDMRGANFIGHTSPTTGSPGDRVKRAGLTPRLLLENIGVGNTPEQVERGLMESPAHRANLLQPEVDRVGIGAAVGGGSGDARELFVTQLFARFPTVRDAADSTTDLRSRLAALRQQAKRPPLVGDIELDKVARTLADALAGGSLTREAAAQRVDTIGPRFADRYGSLRTVVAQLSEISQFASSPSLGDATITHVGLAATPGQRDGNPIVYVVVLLASRR